MRSANEKQAADFEALKQQLADSAEKLQGLEQQLAERKQDAVRGLRCWGLAVLPAGAWLRCAAGQLER
jgi:hypothetical protein